MMFNPNNTKYSWSFEKQTNLCFTRYAPHEGLYSKLRYLSACPNFDSRLVYFIWLKYQYQAAIIYNLTISWLEYCDALCWIFGISVHNMLDMTYKKKKTLDDLESMYWKYNKFSYKCACTSDLERGSMYSSFLV